MELSIQSLKYDVLYSELGIKFYQNGVYGECIGYMNTLYLNFNHQKSICNVIIMMITISPLRVIKPS